MRASALLVLAACGGAAAPASEGGAGTPAPGKRIAIYSEGGAIVVDRRWVEIPEGESRIEIGDLAASIVPASLTMRALGGTLEVRERWFDPGLARAPGAAEAILGDAVGREVVIDRSGQRLRGHLAAVRGGEIVLEENGSLRTVPWRQADAVRVSGRRRVARPALQAHVVARRSGRHLVELVYAAGGLGFSASYAVRVKGGLAEIRPSAHIENASGLRLEHAHIALYSGRLGASDEEERAIRFWTGSVELAAGPGRVETRQLAARPGRAPARLEAVYQGATADAVHPVSEPGHGAASQPQVRRHLVVTASRGGGLPAVLPPGPAVVEIASDRSAEPYRIPTRLTGRVVAGGEARFELDVDPSMAGDRRQVRVERAPDGKQLTEAYEIVVRNRGAASARVRVVEPLTRSRQVSLSRVEPAAAGRPGGAIEWLIEVPAGGEAKVSFEATYRF